MTRNLTVTVDRTKLLSAALKALVKEQVLVGIPQEDAERQPSPDEPRPEITNAQIGYLNEFGSPEQNIPPRPHLIPGVEGAKPQIIKRYESAAKKVLDGDLSVAHSAHEAVGLVCQTAVQAKITNGPFVPLSDRTVQARKAKGRTGEKPLIDTGTYRRAITYVVRSK